MDTYWIKKGARFESKLSSLLEITNAPVGGIHLFAEREGFEPPEAFTSTVFKTAAFDRSAISPGAK